MSSVSNIPIALCPYCKLEASDPEPSGLPFTVEPQAYLCHNCEDSLYSWVMGVIVTTSGTYAYPFNAEIHKEFLERDRTHRTFNYQERLVVTEYTLHRATDGFMDCRDEVITKLYHPTKKLYLN